MGQLRFVKMNGCGNDFIVIDARSQTLPNDLPRWSKGLCDRRFGIGADGVLVIGSSREADFDLRIFNADGSEAEMCGNGARCAALFARRSGAARQMSFTTPAGVIRAEADDKTAAIHLTDPKDYRPNIQLEALSQKLTAHFIDSGVPHAVLFVPDVSAVDVAELGRAIRNHAAFSPRGANVDFVQPIDGRSVRMRTYERGVEAETLACGTGAAAAAIISSRQKGVRPPVNVHVPGCLLVVDFQDDGGSVRGVKLSGDTRFVFEGMIALY